MTRESSENQVDASCNECGVCVSVCDAFRRRREPGVKPREVQRRLRAFLAGEEVDEVVRMRLESCQECFKCVPACPEGANPLAIIEAAKGELVCRDPDAFPYDLDQYNAGRRIFAGLLTSEDEASRIHTASEPRSHGPHRYVFFPGCNVYHQPELLLAAQALLKKTGEDVAFLPGIENCCGDGELFAGRCAEGEARHRDLVEVLAAYRPEAVILWCPTCRLRFEKTFAHVARPFRLISFPEFLAARIGALDLDPLRVGGGSATLHEACKSAYQGWDSDELRTLLSAAGVRITEMERSGRKTSCCGSGAFAYCAELAGEIAADRMDEASRTGADALLTVCHFCHDVFSPLAGQRGMAAINYVLLLAQAAGLDAQERYAPYRRDPDGAARLLAEKSQRAKALPYAEETIQAVVRRQLG